MSSQKVGASAPAEVVGDHWLVADIGGTNARFALARPFAEHAVAASAILEHARTLRVRGHATLQAAIINFLAGIPAAALPRYAVLAVASAVADDSIRFTNSQWGFSISALQQALALDHLLVVSDFAAAAARGAGVEPGRSTTRRQLC